MRRLPIALQLGSMFAVAILLLIAVLGYSVYQFDTNAKEYNDLVHHTNVRTLNLKTAETHFETGLASIRGFLLYADSANEQGVKGALSRSANIVKEFAEGTRAKEVKQNAEKLQSQLEEYIGLSEKIITAKRNNDPSLASLIAETRPKTEAVRKQFEVTLAGQAGTLKTRTNATEAHQRSIENTVLYSSLAIIILVVSLVTWYCRNLARRMNTLRGELIAVSDLDLTRKDIHATRNDEIGDMAEAVITMKQALRKVVGQVRSSADTLAASSEELTSTVEEQLRTSEVIAKTTGDIAAGSAQNTNNITDISAVIEEVNAGAEEMNATGAELNNATQNAVADAKQGMQLIQKVVSQNETIEKSMKEITDVAISLVKGSSEIQEIITVISNIAGQTNLLALNAAIEAARAGEAGRGFAVVADEVRKLAEQSADATNHIGEIIKKMTGDIDFSVNAVNKANTEVAAGKVAAADTAKGFEAIVNKLGQVQSGIEQISHAVEETAKGMQSVVNNIQNISAVAQETSAGTQTVAAASEEQNASLHEVTASAEALAKMATDLNEIIQNFKM